MQLKGLVQIFTLLLILICGYQMTFTWKANSYEKKITKDAIRILENENPGQTFNANQTIVKNKTLEILENSSDKVIYKTIFGKYTYQDVKEKQLNLGLDLQGGMNVVMEVGLDELLLSLSNNPNDQAMKEAIAKANVSKANSQANLINLFVKEYEKANPNSHLASLFAKTDGGEDMSINYNSTNKEVENYLNKKAKGAINQTYNILQKRIDKFGVTNPNINLDEDRGIITVELAGVQNPERVRKYLQASAKLEFWEVFTNVEFWNTYSEKIDLALSNKLKGIVPSDSTVASLDGDTTKTKESMTEEEQKLEHPLSTILMPSVSSDNKQFAQVGEIGYLYMRDSSRFFQYMDYPEVKAQYPGNMKFLFGIEQSDKNGDKYVPVFAIKTIPGKNEAPIEGDKITEAKYDMRDLQPEVTMSMNAQGTQEWARLTEQNIGRPIAICLDQIVYSAPNVNDKIPSGRSSITMGNASEENISQAKDLANILNSGKLDAPAKIVQEQVVGPTLGKESIQAGTKSFMISFLVIFALMLLYYNTSGWVANIALILNLFFTIGLLAVLGATLTMPGIAGLVLTIGMAVDTNVLIFERIKEELRLGKSYSDAVKDGYKRSMAPVLDAHVTTLITAIILFYFGLGPVKGFATTQIIGILLSLFCGILVSRMVTDFYMAKGKHFKYFTKISDSVFQHTNFHFIQFRKYTYIISVIVLIGGIASFFNGFDYGVEFSGGRSYTVRFDKPVRTTDVRSYLDKYFEEYPVVKTIGSDEQLNITTSYMITSPDKNADEKVLTALYTGLKDGHFINPNVSLEDFSKNQIVLSNKVLPTISDDLKKGAMYATILSLIFIAIYIVIRFRKWQYAAGTVIALIHDVCVTLIVFSFFKDVVPFALEIDQHFIAALLTVIGFSMNDTVIVFDRVREYFRKDPKGNKEDIINKAINQTLSRTVMTALTVFLTVLILFIYGGEVTKGFAFAMLIGIITGTYSSIFVAAPVLVDMDKDGSLSAEEDKSERIKALKKMA